MNVIHFTRRLKFTAFAGKQKLRALFFKLLTSFVYSRADCFGTKIFYGCMEALLIKDELKSEVAAYLDDAHSGYYDPLSKK